MDLANVPRPPHGVLLVRHGLTQWNADQRWQGWADIPLSRLGEKQAAFAARTLSKLFNELLRDQSAAAPDIRVVSSDLQRAYTTALAFADALGVARVERIETLRERHVGDWSGLTSREISTRWPGVLERWRGGEQVPLPGGEDETAFRSRILGALTKEVRRSADDGRPSIVVSHGGAIRTIESLLNIESRHVANVGGRWFYWGGATIVPGEPVDLLDEISEADPVHIDHSDNTDHSNHIDSHGRSTSAAL